MRFVTLGRSPSFLPPDSARAAGCAQVSPLPLPGGADPLVLEGAVPTGGKACWTLRLEAGRRLDLSLTSTGGGASLEVRSLDDGAARSSGKTSFSSSSSVSTSSVSIGGARGSSATRVSLGPRSDEGEFLIAVGEGSGRGGAPYRLEVALR